MGTDTSPVSGSASLHTSDSGRLIPRNGSVWWRGEISLHTLLETRQ